MSEEYSNNRERKIIDLRNPQVGGPYELVTDGAKFYVYERNVFRVIDVQEDMLLGEKVMDRSRTNRVLRMDKKNETKAHRRKTNNNLVGNIEEFRIENPTKKFNERYDSEEGI